MLYESPGRCIGNPAESDINNFGNAHECQYMFWV